MPQFPHLSNEGIEQIVSKPFVVVFCLKYIFSFNTASGSKDPTFSMVSQDMSSLLVKKNLLLDEGQESPSNP